MEASKDQKWSIGTKKIEEVKPVVTEIKSVFVPPPPAVEKKGKWGAVPEKKVEEKMILNLLKLYQMLSVKNSTKIIY